MSWIQQPVVASGEPLALQFRTPSRHHLELQDRRDYALADRAARTCWLGCPGLLYYLAALDAKLVTAGGFFKARHRGNPHNVLPGTVQGRSHGGFLDMKKSPPPSHLQPSSSSSGTAFGRAFLGAVTDDARNSSAAYPSPQGSFPLPN
ncbi:hypothetical protein TNCV_3568901 [Trichonephila clavipes]|nr:hypothetical protein TNCV_3568901 [Trichonephila clavipes]